MIYGYCRVSTKGQENGYSLDAQEKEILEKYNTAIIYKESYTGTKLDRPIFTKLISTLDKGDILVVCKLDRFARNTVEGIEVVKKLFSKGVSIHILNIGLLEDTPMGRFFLTTMLAIAELERNMIIERTQAGRQYAREHGLLKNDGRPPKYNYEEQKEIYEYKKEHSYKETCKKFNTSKSSIIRINKFFNNIDKMIILVRKETGETNRFGDKLYFPLPTLTPELENEIIEYKKHNGHKSTCDKYNISYSSIIRIKEEE